MIRILRRRRGVVVAAAVTFVLLVAGAGALGFGGDRDQASPAASRSVATVKVTRATLVNAATADGRLDHGQEMLLNLKATGTVTWLPAAGAVIGRGATVLRVDDRPVVLLFGSIPMYRTLGVPGGAGTPAATGGQPQSTASPGGQVSAEAATGGQAPAQRQSAAAQQVRGRDVKQLKENLAALGYHGFAMDEVYSAQTAAAVRRWQKDLGVPQTGAVELGDVSVAPGEIRVARLKTAVGGDAAAGPLTYTGTGRVATVAAPAGGAPWATVGTVLDVVLPDGKTTPGAVASVGTDASSAADGSAGSSSGQGAGSAGGAGTTATTVPVVISIADQAALGTLDSGPVGIRYVVEQRENVLTVPVAALVALAEGGYGLELTTDRFVPVTTGLFADGRVEVTGTGITEGLTVRIPQ